MNIELIKAFREEIQADYDHAVAAYRHCKRLSEHAGTREDREGYENYQKWHDGRWNALASTKVKLDDLIKELQES